MALIVQKYGGTSVGSVERIQAVARKVRKTVAKGNAVVVVVSAMGNSTDTLVNLAKQISSSPSSREMDMLLSTGEQVSIALLSMALHELGQAAISLTGAQVGIVTDAEHSRARILKIKTERIQRHLELEEVVVVAGFQGISTRDDREITTLGRGGSDTSAVALAASLQAQECQIYTDVDGIFTTDPRLVPSARLMESITCDEMLELASLGAKVLHPRAVEIARNYGVPLTVLSSYSDTLGTHVVSQVPKPRSLTGLEITKAVDGVEFQRNLAKVALLGVADRPGVAANLFGEIARQGIDVDLIIQSIHEGNSNDIAFTVLTEDLDKAEAAARKVFPEVEVKVDPFIAKVEIVGAGMIGRPGVAAQMFSTLAAAKINIQMISTSEVKVSCVIHEQYCDGALAALCRGYAVHNYTKTTTAPNEYLPVRGVALDHNQARLAIFGVPDISGMAAKIFGALADNKISVDTIIQSQRCRAREGVDTRDIAFTVAQEDAQKAKSALDYLAKTLDLEAILIDDSIAKLSIVGAGMVAKPGVAARFFAALAEGGINIQMIATSEIKVSCVIAESEGKKALEIVHDAFELNEGNCRLV
ncbi:MAG: aspartate kinase [Prochloron sp. SP5CPC1]|nr:aspartate kinase [Candidatus Paraprochloron terpiosi SP5CPC1]